MLNIHRTGRCRRSLTDEKRSYGWLLWTSRRLSIECPERCVVGFAPWVDCSDT